MTCSNAPPHEQAHKAHLFEYGGGEGVRDIPSISTYVHNRITCIITYVDTVLILVVCMRNYTSS